VWPAKSDRLLSACAALPVLIFQPLFRRDRLRIMRVAITLLLAAVMLYGCGYKGPLFLPQSKPDAQAAKPAPTPQQEPQKAGTGPADQ